MAPSITQAEFKALINGKVHSKFDQCNDPQVVMNSAVRFVLGNIDLASAKRSAPLSPNLFANVYDYTAPTDLKGEKIIDLRKQVNRPLEEKWNLVDEAEFDRKKNIWRHRIAVRNENFAKILRIDGLENDKKKVIHNCESVTANGTWSATADASNLTLDNFNYITGGGSLNFDMAKGAATGYIENSTMTSLDLTEYDEKGAIFVWAYIPDYSDAQGDTVTNFILRWGNDSSNYWSRTVTTANDGTTFKDGWNLLRFEWNGATETGTVDPSTIDYLRFTVTKSTDLEADTDWRVDNFVISLGDIYETVYYSKYGWQTSAGVYIEESTTTTDLLVADTDEVEMLVSKGAEYASQELKEYEEVIYFRNEYENMKLNYQKNNPSKALKKTRSYGSLPRVHNRY